VIKEKFMVGTFVIFIFVNYPSILHFVDTVGWVTEEASGLKVLLQQFQNIFFWGLV